MSSGAGVQSVALLPFSNLIPYIYAHTFFVACNRIGSTLAVLAVSPVVQVIM